MKPTRQRTPRGAGRPRGSGRGRTRSTDDAPGLATHTSPAEAIGGFLRATRESQNLSQEQLAALTARGYGPVSRAMISAVERGVHLPGVEVLLTLSRTLHIAPAEILERIELAREAQVETTGLDRHELEQAAQRSFWAGDFRRAVAYYDQTLRLLRLDRSLDGGRDAATALLEIRRATALRRHGAISAARAAAERAIALTDDAAELQSQAYVVLAAVLWQSGCLPLARDISRRAVELAEQTDDATVRGYALMQRGSVLLAAGHAAEARDAFIAAGVQVRRADDHKHLITIEGNLGACLQDLAHVDEARAHYLKAVKLARRFEVPAREAQWLIELGRLAVRHERLDEAERPLAAALRLAKPLELWLAVFRAEWWMHRLARLVRPDDADRHRVAYLRKLFVKLEDFRGIEEVAAFRSAYCANGQGADA